MLYKVNDGDISAQNTFRNTMDLLNRMRAACKIHKLITYGIVAQNYIYNDRT